MNTIARIRKWLAVAVFVLAVVFSLATATLLALTGEVALLVLTAVGLASAAYGARVFKRSDRTTHHLRSIEPQVRGIAA